MLELQTASVATAFDVLEPVQNKKGISSTPDFASLHAHDHVCLFLCYLVSWQSSGTVQQEDSYLLALVN